MQITMMLLLPHFHAFDCCCCFCCAKYDKENNMLLLFSFSLIENKTYFLFSLQTLNGSLAKRAPLMLLMCFVNSSKLSCIICII